MSSRQNTTGKCENTRKQLVFVLVHVKMPYSRRLQRRNLPERIMSTVQNAKDKYKCIVSCILCVKRSSASCRSAKTDLQGTCRHQAQCPKQQKVIYIRTTQCNARMSSLERGAAAPSDHQRSSDVLMVFAFLIQDIPLKTRDSSSSTEGQHRGTETPGTNKFAKGIIITPVSGRAISGSGAMKSRDHFVFENGVDYFCGTSGFRSECTGTPKVKVVHTWY
jgi:hypothetical protein